MLDINLLTPLILQIQLFTQSQQKTNQLLTDQNKLLTQILSAINQK